MFYNRLSVIKWQSAVKKEQKKFHSWILQNIKINITRNLVQNDEYNYHVSKDLALVTDDGKNLQILTIDD